MLKISILVDTPDSWIIPFAQAIRQELAKQHQTTLYSKSADIPQGDMLFLLGCTSIVPPEILQRNMHNLVIHESDLPKGRGWVPIAWQVLEGKNRIPIVLFEAVKAMDAGPIYLKDYIELDGTELLPEIKRKQGEKTAELIYTFIDNWPDIQGKTQKGTPTYYQKRTKKDDELDPEKTLIEHFDHLRIVDNDRYPAWFKYKGQRYILKIYKTE